MSKTATLTKSTKPTAYDLQYADREGRENDYTAHCAALGGFSVLLYTTWNLVLSNDPKSLGWFAYHPPLMSLALVLFTYGALVLQPTVKPESRVKGLETHQKYAALLGLPALAFGATAIQLHKYETGAEHFVTWHSKLGFATVAWLVTQILVGGATVWFGGAIVGGPAKARSFYKLHRLSGYFVLTALLATLHLGGAYSNWSNAVSTFETRLWAYYAAPVAILGGLLFRLRPEKFFQ